MKVLSIKQPWGSVICSGLKHVENRSWGPKTLPLRILIHVGATKVPKDNDDYLPEEWLSLMRNARTKGCESGYKSRKAGRKRGRPRKNPEASIRGTAARVGLSR